jgi:hypothetical protein
LRQRIFWKAGIAILFGIIMNLNFAASVQAKLPTCSSDYKKHYLHGPSHKAIATTGGQSPLGTSRMSCGTAWGFDTKSQAIKAALRQCRATDKKFKDPGDCQIVEAK